MEDPGGTGDTRLTARRSRYRGIALWTAVGLVITGVTTAVVVSQSDDDPPAPVPATSQPVATPSVRVPEPTVHLGTFPSVGAIVFETRSDRLAWSYLGVFDRSGRTQVCTRGHKLSVVAASHERILFTRQRSRAQLWAVPSDCSSKPDLLFTLPDEAAIPGPRVRCVGLRPSGLAGVIFEGSRRYDKFTAYGEAADGTWHGIRSAGRCTWVAETLSISEHFFPQESSPYLIDSVTGDMVFAERPLLLTGRLSPNGRFVHSPQDGRDNGTDTHEGAIVDLGTGDVVGTPGGFAPGYSSCCSERDSMVQSPWAPDGGRLLVNRARGGDQGARRIWDIGASAFIPTRLRLNVPRWIDDDTIVTAVPNNEFVLYNIQTKEAVTIALPGRQPRAKAAYGFSAPPSPTAATLITGGDVPVDDYRELVRFPLPPGWRKERCRSRDDGTALPGTGCKIDGYEFDRELVSPSTIYENADVIAFGRTDDTVGAVVRRLSEQDPDCEQDGEHCKRVHRRYVLLDGTRFVKVERGFYEWSNAVFVGRVDGRTVLIQLGSAKLDEFDAPVGWILDHLEVGSPSAQSR